MEKLRTAKAEREQFVRAKVLSAPVLHARRLLCTHRGCHDCWRWLHHKMLCTSAQQCCACCAREQQLEELMERLKIAEAEREQLTRHNMLLERAIVARDRVAAEFSDAKTAGGGGYGLESPKVPLLARPASLMQSFLALI